MTRLHVLGLCHTNLTDEFSWCAYTGKVRRFAPMMTDQGFDVVTYHSGLGEDNPRWDRGQYVAVITENERVKRYPPHPRGDNTPPWTAETYHSWNLRAIVELAKRVEPGDVICISAAGHLQRPIAEAFPDNLCVEFGVGYEGTFTVHRAFESYAWMHCVYGYQQGAMGANGLNFDAVIPNYYDTEQFPITSLDREGPLLYLARLEERKGMREAIEVANHAKRPMVMAGAGALPTDMDLELVEHVGVVGPRERAELMGSAAALIQPTRFVEPFGGCVVEAQLCGLPVITSDYGAFTETVAHGVTGYRCRTLKDYVWAVFALDGLERGDVIRESAQLRWSMEAVGPSYSLWLDRCLDFHGGGGWYTAP